MSEVESVEKGGGVARPGESEVRLPPGGMESPSPTHAAGCSSMPRPPVHVETTPPSPAPVTDPNNPITFNDLDAGGDPAASLQFVAPVLRVEELKEKESSALSMLSSSSTCGSDDDGIASSFGDASDQDLSAKEGDGGSEFTPPDDELKEKVIKQVEFYFSDANILKDAFLLKHVRRNKQGYVSLKLITSFRRVKSITRDYRVVAYSLRQSENLEVNVEGTKVRRIEPLPEYDETVPSRTTIAVNLPFDNPTIENIAELFSGCGDIVLIRILRPGKTIPPDVKKHFNKHPELGNAVCAVIEYEHHDSAKKACEAMTNRDDWRKGLRVVLLAQPKRDKQGKDKEKMKGNNDVNESGDADISRDSEKDLEIPQGNGKAQEPNAPTEEKKKKKRGGKKRANSRVDELTQVGDSAGYNSSGSEADSSENPDWRRGSGGSVQTGRSSLSPKPDPNRLSPSTTPRTTPRSTPLSSPRSSPRGSPNLRRRPLHGKSPLAADALSPGASPRPSPAGSPEMQRRKNSQEMGGGAGELGTSPSSSPWVQRRLKAQQVAGVGGTAGSSPGASPRLGRRTPDGRVDAITRQPRGPDGTKGFGMGRGKIRSETV